MLKIDVRTQIERSGSDTDMNDRYSLLNGGQDGIRPWVGRLKIPPEKCVATIGHSLLKFLNAEDGVLLWLKAIFSAGPSRLAVWWLPRA
jgi:hypothetical protein